MSGALSQDGDAAGRLSGAFLAALERIQRRGVSLYARLAALLSSRRTYSPSAFLATLFLLRQVLKTYSLALCPFMRPIPLILVILENALSSSICTTRIFAKVVQRRHCRQCDFKLDSHGSLMMDSSQSLSRGKFEFRPGRSMRRVCSKARVCLQCVVAINAALKIVSSCRNSRF